MRYRITTPEPSYSGQVGGVTFADGTAEVDEVAQELPYFRNAGYGVDPVEPPAEGSEGGTEAPVGAGGNPPDGSTQPPSPERPAGNGSTEAWRAYAIFRGVPEAEAAPLTRDELKERVAEIDKESTP
jgi:hypothetical protein